MKCVLHKQIARFTILLLAVSSFGVVFGANAVRAAATTTVTAKALPSRYTRLFYFRDSRLARESLYTYPSSIDIFAPQSYAFSATSTLVGSVNPSVLAFALSHHMKVMPLVTNDGFGETAYQALLGDPAKEDAAIAALVAEALRRGYVGWQIDFEQMDVSYRDRFSEFIARMHTAFAQAGLTLSVAVVAQISENPADYKNTLWQDLIGVYDYAALASSTDFVSLMSYDQPDSSGPVAEYPWLTRVLDFALARIPANKLSLGIPLFYWQYADASGKRVGIGGREGIYHVFSRHKVSAHYSVKYETPYLHYWSRAKGYTLWYENERSVRKKVALVKEHKLFGISAWALGLELPGVFNALRQ